LTEKIAKSFKQRLAQIILVPSEGGCFEVSIDDELIYSKLTTGKFPEEDAIIAEVGKRLS
jgi:selenoprotein W-related protein